MFKSFRNLKALIIPLVFTVILLLTGCGNQSGTTPATPVSTTAAQTEVELNVAAAASMTDALNEINKQYRNKNSKIKVTVSYASSGTLQKQIENGAPTDVFISAAAKQMDALQTGGLIIESSRQNLLTNRVVLVVPSDSSLNITSFNDLVKPEIKQVAIGDPQFVPAGTYGQQALEVLGIKDQVQSKLILGSDVRQVLSYVESGNVDAGIVYSTDAAISDKVKIAAEGPEEINAKIVYPVAVIKSSKLQQQAQGYIDYLFSSEATAVFEKFGFKALEK